MSQLLGLAIDELKIDKSFILELNSDRRARAIVRSAIEVARALDLTVVAEGIECTEILQSLQGMGTDIGQGYAISCPSHLDNSMITSPIPNLFADCCPTSRSSPDTGERVQTSSAASSAGGDRSVQPVGPRRVRWLVDRMRCSRARRNRTVWDWQNLTCACDCVSTRIGADGA